jgi:cation transport regulator ChaB
MSQQAGSEEVHTLPESAQGLYQNVYNNSLESRIAKDEVAANRLAWKAIRQFYDQDEGGHWMHR